MTHENKKYLILSYTLGTGLLLIDFFTKYLANSILKFHQKTDSFINGLSFYLTHNTGYHYIFGEINNHTLWSIFGLGMLIFLLVSLTMSMLREKDGFFKKLYTVILVLTVGAGGNVLEILVTKKATDFFMVAPFPWPSNICDQYINIIIYVIMPIMLIKLLLDKFKKRKEITNKDAGSE